MRGACPIFHGLSAKVRILSQSERRQSTALGPLGVSLGLRQAVLQTSFGPQLAAYIKHRSGIRNRHRRGDWLRRFGDTKCRASTPTGLWFVGVLAPDR